MIIVRILYLISIALLMYSSLILYEVYIGQCYINEYTDKVNRLEKAFGFSVLIISMLLFYIGHLIKRLNK